MGQRGRIAPWQVKCKKRILVFFWFLVGCFFRLSLCFPVISGLSIDINIRIHYHFSTFFRLLAGGPHSAKFPTPWLKPLVTPLVEEYAEDAVVLFIEEGAR